MEGREREKKIRQPVTHRPGSWPCAGRRMDSEIGVARNWSEDSAARRLKVSAKSRDSWRTTWMSMCSGSRNSSSLEDLLDAAAILLACFFWLPLSAEEQLIWLLNDWERRRLGDGSQRS